MDANYCSGTYLRDRLPSPYAGFGAAMPMRFCRPDGRLIQVFQQHTHHMDDVMFHPSVDYSYKISPEPYEGIVDRIYADITSRHQTPFAVCIHPSNWVKFSRPQGQALLRLAKDRAMPIWSFDQWCLFWQARDGWEFQDVGWEEGRLRFRAEGGIARDDLGIDIPDRAEGKCLLRIHLDSKPVTAQVEASAGEGVSVVGLPGGRTSVEVVAEYG
jgi:hypothetical protein